MVSIFEEIDDIIFSIAIFYKGAASIEWLQNQPISTLEKMLIFAKKTVEQQKREAERCLK